MGRDTAFMCVGCRRTKRDLIHIHNNNLCTECYNQKKMAASNQAKVDRLFKSIEKNIQILSTNPEISLEYIKARINLIFGK